MTEHLGHRKAHCDNSVWISTVIQEVIQFYLIIEILSFYSTQSILSPFLAVVVLSCCCYIKNILLLSTSGIFKRTSNIKIIQPKKGQNS